MMKLSSKILTQSVSAMLLLAAGIAALAQNTPGYNNKIPEVIMTPDEESKKRLFPCRGFRVMLLFAVCLLVTDPCSH